MKIKVLRRNLARRTAKEEVQHAPDVARPGGGEVPDEVGGERDPEHVLRERLGAQHRLLVAPVPDGQHVVGVPSHRGQQLPVWAAQTETKQR